MSTRPRRSTTANHVLIAGAGLAGLSAARELEDRGFRTTIIDARDRVGGRVFTCRGMFAGRQHAEGGADLIESDQEAVRALAKRLRLKVVPILRRGFGFYGPNRAGRLVRQSGFSALAPINEPLAELVRDYRLDEQRWNGPIAQRLAGKSVADWVRELTRGRPRADVEQLITRFRGFRGLFLADPEDLSLLALVDFFADDPFSDAGGDMQRVVGGNDQLATGLAASLAGPILLTSVLRRLRLRPSGVTAAIEGPAGLSTLHADFAIVTLPPPPLRKVVFEPHLPPQQRDAIKRIRMGPATRMLLQFESRFWARRRQPSLFGSAEPTGAVWDGNEEQRGGAILSLLAGGGASAGLQALIKTEGAEGVARSLSWLGRPGPLVASHVVTWERDPWAGGGYAVFGSDFDPRLREWLARPFGRVLFAGEHTSVRWQGYMNGAIQSGQRAAAEVTVLAAL